MRTAPTVRTRSPGQQGRPVATSQHVELGAKGRPELGGNWHARRLATHTRTDMPRSSRADEREVCWNRCSFENAYPDRVNVRWSWGKTPRQSIEQECARRGREAVIAGCMDLINGGDSDAE